MRFIYKHNGASTVGDRFNYYLKLILNGSVDEYALISEQLENDLELSVDEAEELEHLISRYMQAHNYQLSLRIINTVTGNEELPPKTSVDNFGDTADYLGEEVQYGIKWKVYTPRKGFLMSPVKKWYYNEHIASLLAQALIEVVPGRFPSYFDTPPWVLGTVMAPGSRYIPLAELIELAISKGTIAKWDQLVQSGIPADYVNAIRSTRIGFQKDSFN